MTVCFIFCSVDKKRQRKPRFTQHFDRENVTTRQLAIVVAYAKLKKIAEVCIQIDLLTALKKNLRAYSFWASSENGRVSRR